MITFSERNMRIWSRLGPSGAVGAAAIEIAENEKNMVVMTADLCFFSGLERFKAAYPDNLYNLGIAEQNMIGVAAGMAKEGFIPFVTTYASFAASRCLDQIRVNMAYMKLPIKLIGLTAGFGAGILGATHMSVEDISVMRALPNIVVLSPADCSEIIKCMMAASKSDQPTYIRLTGAAGRQPVYKEDYEFEIGKAIRLVNGRDVCIFATGSVVSEAIAAAKTLLEEGISCSVINMHTIKPLDTDTIEQCVTTHKLIVTVEEHSIFGGLGGAVSEYLAKNNAFIPLEIIGIEDCFAPAGGYNYQLEWSGLTALQIANRIRNRIQ